MLKRLLCALLCLCFLLSLSLPVLADEASTESPKGETLNLYTVDCLIKFANDCRLDSYSENLTVTLRADLDMEGIAFSGIPTFSGTFNGNGHTISGLSITENGSVMGLFRYLTPTAIVQDLTVSGQVCPGGSRDTAGGIAGQNEGLLRNCQFTGSVFGSDYAGGLVGVNLLTGILENCKVNGSIIGDHFIGGIAGTNHGVIRNCYNRANINTTSQQNTVSLSDITIDTLTNTESANTVTDIGGITGINDGVIRECTNFGNVGYQYMGYNVGGIAGTQSGYLVECRNYGTVHGRKEVGGIVGQMEPAYLIAYSEDTLQILERQLDDLSNSVSGAVWHAQSNSAEITGQLTVLLEQVQSASNALNLLLPESESDSFPDADALLAAQSTLSSSLSAMAATIRNITSAISTTTQTMIQDLNTISDQISAMQATLGEASEHLGGGFRDVSDEDTPEDTSGKVDNCVNYGNLLGDLNVGGIAGAIAMENDLDTLQDWDTSGDTSMNFQGELRAVVANSKNFGTVISKKQNAGGIAGWQSFGLIKACVNTGILDASNATYVGGIAGLSTGYVRNCYAKCILSGNSFVGGIAGSGTIVTDSIAQVDAQNTTEKVGGILGLAEESQTETENPIAGNYCLSLPSVPGAIDGISYSGKAESLEQDSFYALTQLPDLFKKATVSFLFEDGTFEEIQVAPGEYLSEQQIPALPAKDGHTATWEGLDTTDLTNILFDMTFTAVYTPYPTTLDSARQRENGLPLLLAEGFFTQTEVIFAEPSDVIPVTEKNAVLLEVWSVQVKDNCSTLRFQLPLNTTAEQVQLLLETSDGTWEPIPYHQDGSYLVFSPTQNEFTFALVSAAKQPLLLYLVIGGVTLLILASIFFLRHRKRKSQGIPSHSEPEL